MVYQAQVGADGWSARSPAVSAGWVDDGGCRRLAVLSHPTLPFPDAGANPNLPLDRELRRIALAYLGRVRETYSGEGEPRDAAFDAACAMLPASVDEDVDGFGWLGIRWGGGAEDPDPRLSFWVARRHEGVVADRTVVLLAANASLEDGRQVCEGSAVGLRVVMHVAVAQNAEAPTVVRVTGLSASRLRLARDPGQARLLVQQRLALRATAMGTVRAGFSFAEDGVSVGSISFPPGDAEALFVGTGHQGGNEDIQAGRARVFEWSVRMAVDPVGVTSWTTGPLVAMASEALADTAVLVSEPARAQAGLQAPPGPAAKPRPLPPTTKEAVLEGVRVPAQVETPQMRDPRDPPRFAVRQSIVADRESNPAELQRVQNAGDVGANRLRLRSDLQSAVHAYVRAQEFFDRLDAYGLGATDYFKMARLPLLLRHRAWFFNQPDGLSVNAMVRPDRASQSYYEAYQTEKRPQLEVRFGAANLEHRAQGPNDHGQQRAQPMGIAADPRIAWHEFGHVLSYAATGALEFHFAHSAGDALAAILADPGAWQAAEADCRTDPDDPAGLTFPWLKLPRRHDRQARLGWCWCGRRNAMRRAPFRLPAPLFKGYTEEQMLSSSMFRVYRVLGGDSFGAPARRAVAADYAAYLIIRAIALLGPAAVLPALSAEAFAAALIDADVGTGAWNVTVPAPGGAPQPRSRCGGTAHKVIRWAFEQQGLYAADRPQDVVEGVGRPPPVDLYLRGHGGRAAGDYAPVDLQWNPDDAAPAAWFADPGAMQTLPGAVIVDVFNRGSGPDATGPVTARAWVAPVPAEPGGNLVWQSLGAGDPVPPIPGGGFMRFSFATAAVAPFYLLAEVHCDGDRSNLHPDSQLACSGNLPPAAPLHLADLVANDNNLALWRVAP